VLMELFSEGNVALVVNEDLHLQGILTKMDLVEVLGRSFEREGAELTSS